MADTSGSAAPAHRIRRRREHPEVTGGKRVITFTNAEGDGGVRSPAVKVINAPVISIDSLYPAEEAVRQEVFRALGLLARAIDHLGAARAADQRSDVMGGDREVQTAQSLLPELFECRAIGEGFANVINTLQITFVQRRGVPLTRDQILTIWRVLRELRSHLFLTFDDSLLLVAELENSGLEIYPATLADLLVEADE